MGSSAFREHLSVEDISSCWIKTLPKAQRTRGLRGLSKVQGVSKKRYFLDFLSYFSSRCRISLFHMCFGIRISSPFHLAIQKVSIQNLNCPKNACADMIFIPALRSEDWAGIKIMSAHAFLAFLGQLRFWMDTIWIARWNSSKFWFRNTCEKVKSDL